MKLLAPGREGALFRRLPRAFDELHDRHPKSVPKTAEHHSERCRRLAFPRSRVDDDEATVDDGFRHTPILDSFAPLDALRIVVSGFAPFGIRHTHPPPGLSSKTADMMPMGHRHRDEVRGVQTRFGTGPMAQDRAAGKST